MRQVDGGRVTRLARGDLALRPKGRRAHGRECLSRPAPGVPERPGGARKGLPKGARKGWVDSNQGIGPCQVDPDRNASSVRSFQSRTHLRESAAGPAEQENVPREACHQCEHPPILPSGLLALRRRVCGRDPERRFRSVRKEQDPGLHKGADRSCGGIPARSLLSGSPPLAWPPMLS